MADFLSKAGFDIAWKKITNRLKKTLLEGNNYLEGSGFAVTTTDSGAIDFNHKSSSSSNQYSNTLNIGSTGNYNMIRMFNNGVQIGNGRFEKTLNASTNSAQFWFGPVGSQTFDIEGQNANQSSSRHRICSVRIGYHEDRDSIGGDDLYFNGDIILGTTQRKHGTRLHANGGSSPYKVRIQAKSGTLANLDDVYNTSTILKWTYKNGYLGDNNPGWVNVGSRTTDTAGVYEMDFDEGDVIGLKVYNPGTKSYEGVLIGSHSEEFVGGNLKRDDYGRLYFDIAKEISITELYKDVPIEDITASAMTTKMRNGALVTGTIYRVAWTGHTMNDSALLAMKNAGITINIMATANSTSTINTECTVESINGSSSYGSVNASGLICECSLTPSQFSSGSTKVFNVNKMKYVSGSTNIETNYDFINTLWRRKPMSVNIDLTSSSHDTIDEVATDMYLYSVKATSDEDRSDDVYMNTFVELPNGYSDLTTDTTLTTDNFAKPQFPSKSVATINGYNLVICTTGTFTDAIGGITYNKEDISNLAGGGGWTICGDNMNFDLHGSWVKSSCYILGHLRTTSTGTSFGNGLNMRENEIDYGVIQFIGRGFCGNKVKHATIKGSGGMYNCVIEHSSITLSNVGLRMCRCSDVLVDSYTLSISSPTPSPISLTQMGTTLPSVKSNASIWTFGTSNVYACSFEDSRGTIDLNDYKMTHCKYLGYNPAETLTANNTYNFKTSYKIYAPQIYETT